MNLSGHVLERLREDESLVLFRASRAADGTTMLVFVPVSPACEASVVARLEHELSLCGFLSTEWSTKPIALVQHEGRPALLLEDPGGRSAERLVGTCADLDHFLTIAIGSATTLCRLHDRGLIHKDIRPANMLVDGSGAVRLTGFGYASRATKECQGFAPPDAIAGTLAYMAPEQTGRMNRSIDARSDLYALGTTLYEILVGSLPFSAAEPMEWIHSHIARAPPPPSVRMEGVPPAIDAILLKLLAKNAEDRYQTAAGLQYDLHRCRDALRVHRRIELFALGDRDASARLRIPEKLVGRQREVDALVGAFDRVATGGGFDLMLVSGDSGIGKSSVVGELRARLHGSNAFFAAAKFDKARMDIPFATLAQAFAGLLRQILSLDDASLDSWRRALLEALGASALLVVDLVPDLALVIGEQPHPPILSTNEESARFHFVIRQFIGVFATKEHPLVLFLDDLQWLDPAMLELFELLCGHEEIPYLLLVGAYRHNALDESPGLASALASVAAIRGPLNEIRLTDLARDDVATLVSDALHMDLAEASDLAELVHKKTRGNAFFAVQFLTTLEIDGLLRFDRTKGAWTWDLDGIRAQAMTENLSELMATRLLRYDGVQREIIKQLACFGTSATSAILSIALGVPEGEIDAALLDLVSANLLLRHERGYAFAHDGVQDAAYALIPEHERSSMHLQAGQLLRRGVEGKDLEEAIFGIVNQLNRGAALVKSVEARLELAELNLVAGKRAKAATAYASAISYLSMGCFLLPAEGWDIAHRTTFELQLHLADCEFATGEIDSAERRLSIAADHSADLSDLATVVGRQMILYTYQGKIEKAQSIALPCLSRMGVSLSATPTDADVEAEYRALRDNIGGRVIASFFDLPIMTDAHWLNVMNLLTELLGPAGVLNSNLLDLVMLRMANISIREGHCDASCHCYTNIGARILGWRFGDFDSARAFGELALRLVDERGFDRYASRVYSIISGTISPWSAPLRDSFDIAFRAIDMPRERGGIAYAGYAWVCGITALLDSGKHLGDVERIAKTALAAATKSQFVLVIEFIKSQIALVQALRNGNVTEATFHGSEMTREEHEAFLASGAHLWHGLLRYSIRRLQFLVYFGLETECIEIVRTVDRDFGPPPILANSPVFEVVEYCLFSGLARAASLTRETACAANSDFTALCASQAHLAEWATRCPENFQGRACLLAAEIARLEGRDLEAQRLYDDAARSAQAHGFVQIEALANELAARFYTARSFEVIAEAYLRNAHACYIGWGADAKARQLERRYPYLVEGTTRATAPAKLADARLRDLDFTAVVAVYQALSSEIVLDRLIERLMIAVVETGGAVRGLLLLPRNDEMRIVAEAKTAEGGVTVELLPRSHPARGLPRSIVNYVIHSREPVIIDDAAEQNPYAADEYLVRARPRSVLCLPLLKQQRLAGLLYLENDLASHIFTPDRLSLLQLLASQAAISLENAELFRDIQKTQEQARRVGEDLKHSFDMIPALAWRASAGGLLEFANKQWHDFTGIPPAEANGMRWISAFHADDREKVVEKWHHLLEFETSGEFEARMKRHDGDVRRFLVRATPLRDARGVVISWHGTNTDIENLKRAEQAQEALARVSRITAMGELTVSIAHEVNQPLMAIVTNAATCLRWLADDQLNIEEARVAAERIIRHGHRAGDVIASIRALAKKAAPEPTKLDLREVIFEVLLLTRNELDRHSITADTDLSSDSFVIADRVQMQQVILNLVVNSIEAMAASHGPLRRLKISSRRIHGGYLQIDVSDTGIGLAQPESEEIFEVFFTTKQDGIGIGLSICRSIIEVHRGRLWASPNDPHGTAFHFTVPICGECLA